MLDLGPETSLLGRALERWGCRDAEELLYALTRIGGLHAPEPGRFADAVLDEAEQAIRSRGRSSRPWRAAWALRTRERLPYRAARWIVPARPLRRVLSRPSLLLRTVLQSRVPDGRPVCPDVDPVAGAVLIAADRVGMRRISSTSGRGPRRAGEPGLTWPGSGSSRRRRSANGVKAIDAVTLDIQDGEFMVWLALPAAESRRCCG